MAEFSSEQDMFFNGSEGSAVVIEADEAMMVKGIYTKHVPQLYPVELCDVYSVSADCVKELSYAYLMSCPMEVKRNKWTIHEVPDLIEMTGDEFYSLLYRDGTFTYISLDLFGRMVDWFDSVWHGSEDRTRFRCVVHPCWLGAISMEIDLRNCPKTREFFLGYHLKYDICSCRMLMVPHVLEESMWVLYALDTCEKKLHVLDPHLSIDGEDVVEAKHGSMCKKVVEGLAICATTFYAGWEVNPNEWEYVYHSSLNPKLKREHTGFAVAHYILYFEGHGLRKTIEQAGGIGEVKMDILQLFAKMGGNKAMFPPEI